MSLNQIFLFIWFALNGATIGMSLMTLRRNQRTLKELEGIEKANVEALAASGKVIAALAFRISPNGHVDLTLEELNAVSGVELFGEEDGCRILAR